MARKRKPPVAARAALTAAAAGGVRLEASWPPAANNLHLVAHGRKVLSSAGRDYHAAVLAAALEAGSPKIPRGRLRATLDAYPPDNRRRDVINLEKVLSDSLVKACVIHDDCLIRRWLITMHDVEPGGRVVLTVFPW